VRVAVLNGPNLNLLGTREPERYGHESLAEVERRLGDLAHGMGLDIEFAQHNGEGGLVDIIHQWRGRVHGAVVNAGAYSHSSLAIRDALVGVSVPFVEVHITNVFAREPERHHSMLAPAAIGVVAGLGVAGYELALQGLVTHLKAHG
jgi:3-dehydroquinate dehydratase II